MGTMIFKMCPDSSSFSLKELERSTVAGGQDGMPYPTHVTLDNGNLTLTRQVSESGFLIAPWSVEGAGRFMVSSATLMERANPYYLAVELARGKLNQVRGQSSDWLMGGLVLPDDLKAGIQEATRTFGRAVTHLPAPEAMSDARRALGQGFAASHRLVQTYCEQVFEIRHGRQARLDTFLGSRLSTPPQNEDHIAAVEEAFNSLSLPFNWADIEPTEDCKRWDASDALVQWALDRRMQVIGGPLVDFSGHGLPNWLWEKATDLSTLCGYLADYVGMVADRYQHRIRIWHVTAGSNCAGVLALGDEDLLWLTSRLTEAVRRVDPSFEVVIGLAQPWGDYLAYQERNQSPFVFADSLIRTGMKLTSLDLEVVLGMGPRGSYCRDLLDISRMLDLYALLGLPLQVTLGYPSAAGSDPRANPDERVGSGHWREGYSLEAQADWAAAVATLCVCKPFVRTVQWAHFSDAQPHQFPYVGLVDAHENLKPALRQLTTIRGRHLK